MNLNGQALAVPSMFEPVSVVGKMMRVTVEDPTASNVEIVG